MRVEFFLNCMIDKLNTSKICLYNLSDDLDKEV